MYRNNFKIVCPYCSKTIDLYDEAYEKSNENIPNDALFDENSFDFLCPECKEALRIFPSAIWSYEVEKEEEIDA